jgi:hypothetical protein
MLKINACLLLFVCLIMFNEEAATQNYPLRKFAVSFKNDSKLMEKFVQIHRGLMLRKKEVEILRREEEERKKKEEEQKMEDLRRKVFHEHLLNQITGQSTVLKDFYNRF